VKRSGRDELMWVAIHMCMEIAQEISLHRYLYLKLAKTLYLSYYLMLSLQQIGYKKAEQHGGWGGGGGPNIVYTCE
jgi:hypothetical protein